MGFVTFADWVTTMPAWVQGLPEGLQNIIYQIFQTFVFEDRWRVFWLNGLKTTFIIALGALILGIVVGILIAVVRSAHDSKRTRPGVVLRVLNAVCKLYLTVIRGTPVMVQLLLMGFVIMVPKLGSAEATVCAVITFGINSGAYVAEIVRSGIMSVDQGQMEAGRSLGLNYVQTMRYIIVPQAIKNILPALGNEMITLVKETSVVMVISVRDLTQAAKVIASKTYLPLVPYISLALIYLVIVLIMTKLLAIFERRLRESDRR